jgi:hypothetical protein
MFLLENTLAQVDEDDAPELPATLPSPKSDEIRAVNGLLVESDDADEKYMLEIESDDWGPNESLLLAVKATWQ